MVRRSHGRRRWVRAQRLLRRLGRVFVAMTVVLALFGSATSLAAAAVAAAASSECACVHDEKKACPCCDRDHDGENGCLPMTSACAPAQVLAPPIAQDALVPLPMLAGLASALTVAPLQGRIEPLRLERPPRA